jgi:hypothetical protein
MLPIFLFVNSFGKLFLPKPVLNFFYPEIKAAKISFFQRHQRSISLIKIEYTLNQCRLI